MDATGAAYVAVLLGWAYGLFRFVHLPPTLANRGRLKRWMWMTVLIAAGVFAGAALSLDRIQSRAVILLALVPVLAWIDNRMVYGGRRVGFPFFLAICFFEIATVFLVATAIRVALDRII